MSGSASDEIEGALPAEKAVDFATKDAPSTDLAEVEDAIAIAKGFIAAALRRKIKWLEPQGAKQRNLILLSLLLAVVALVVWWYCRGEALLVVWRLSYPLCFVSSMWTYFLKKTMGVHVVFYSFSRLLLAYFADTELSPSIGVLVVHCNTHLAACLVGYALAEHRQHEGTERSAYLVPDMTKEEEGKLRPLRTQAGIIISVFLLALVAFVAWLLWHSADYPTEDLVGVLSFTLSATSLFGTLFTSMHLRGRPISPLLFSFVSLYFLVVFFSYIVMYENQTLGDGAAICGFGGLAVTVLFGYCLSVLDTFKQIKKDKEVLELQKKRATEDTLRSSR